MTSEWMKTKQLQQQILSCGEKENKNRVTDKGRETNSTFYSSEIPNSENNRCASPQIVSTTHRWSESLRQQHFLLFFLLFTIIFYIYISMGLRLHCSVQNVARGANECWWCSVWSSIKGSPVRVRGRSQCIREAGTKKRESAPCCRRLIIKRQRIVLHAFHAYRDPHSNDEPLGTGTQRQLPPTTIIDLQEITLRLLITCLASRWIWCKTQK